MIATVHQPEHLPWLGYFHKMAMAERYVLLDSVQYRHHYFQNRNRILGMSGAQWLTVPVLKLQDNYGPINEQSIDNKHHWRAKYWRSICNGYSRHPYFDTYAERLEAIVMAPTASLLDLNWAFIDFFRSELGVRTPVVRSSDLGIEGAKSDLILNLCRALGASCYLSGPSGRDYLDEAAFREAGVAVTYHDFAHPTYSQRGRKEFTPLLSTLDLLMNCGPESRAILGLDDLAAPRETVRQPAVLPA